MPIPVLGYSQETGFQFGLGVLYSTYLDKNDTLNRSSNFSGTSEMTTQKQYLLSLRGDVWTKRNDIHLIGELRLKRTPFNFYGIGNKTLASNMSRLVSERFGFLIEAEKKVIRNVYSGISVGFDKQKFTNKTEGGYFDTNPDILGKRGGSVLFLGISQAYDNRNSNNYPTHGLFARATFQYAPDNFSTRDFKASQFKFTVSNFWTVMPKVVLGVNGYFQTIQSNTKRTPFYLLPQLGSDEMMRGYYSGRFRDENYITAQAELRYRFSNRFAVVAFGGLGKVYPNGQLSFTYLKPSYGGGARYFFDPAKGLSVRMDYGIGEKPINETRQTGFYISLGEAF